ncbi:hypothetical protein V8C26DRAFT_388616 [Trichoderma gracile]
MAVRAVQLSEIDPPGHSNCKQPLERIPSSFAALRILTLVLAAGRWSYFPPPRTRRAINPSTSVAAGCWCWSWCFVLVLVLCGGG